MLGTFSNSYEIFLTLIVYFCLLLIYRPLESQKRKINKRPIIKRPPSNNAPTPLMGEY